MLALLLLVLPLRWLLAAMTAAAFHEFCHFAAVYLCGSRIRAVRVRENAAILEAEDLQTGEQIFCLLAGPLGSLLLLPLSGWIPRIAVCAAFQSLYNLLPVYPLDGGRVLRCGMQILCPKYGDQICLWTERCCLIAVWAVALYGTFVLKLGLFPVILAAGIFLRTKSGKISCNEKPLGLQ